MTAAGVLHFAHPATFARVVPAYLPAHTALVLVSGFFEVAGGIGILIPFLRRAAGWGLIALYVAVFPANINMALHPDPAVAEAFRTLLWLRLLLQALLIAWAWWVAAKPLEKAKVDGSERGT